MTKLQERLREECRRAEELLIDPEIDLKDLRTILSQLDEAQANRSEAERLLRIAFVATYRLRLQDRGHDLSLSHELREFSHEFSEDDTSGKHGQFKSGNGAYRSWRKKARELFAQPPAVAEDVVERLKQARRKGVGMTCSGSENDRQVYRYELHFQNIKDMHEFSAAMNAFYLPKEPV